MAKGGSIDSNIYDLVFILSSDEIQRYFTGDRKRRARLGKSNGCIDDRRPVMWIDISDLSGSLVDVKQVTNNIHKQHENNARQIAGLKMKAETFLNSNTHDSVEWMVVELDEKSHKALAIAKSIIMLTSSEEVVGLSTWLNNSFYGDLPAHIRQRIIEVSNQNPDSGSMPNTQATRDRVFLLSVNEASRYFQDRFERTVKHRDVPVGWWLRSRGTSSSYATVANISPYGDIDSRGSDSGNYGIRPAIWVDYAAEAPTETQRKEVVVADKRRALRKRAGELLNGTNSNGSNTMGHIVEIKSIIDSLKAQENQLETKKNRYGLFDFEPKRKIDAQLDTLYSQREELQDELAVLLSKPQSYLWDIIDIDEDNNKVLAITKDIVAEMYYCTYNTGGSKYHDINRHYRGRDMHENLGRSLGLPDIDITWENCHIRRWLHNDFFNSLPDIIRSKTVEIINQTPHRPGYNAPVNPTRDKVFLLSIEEVNKYLPVGSMRGAQYQGEDYCWWLRSPGEGAVIAMFVYGNGYINKYAGSIGSFRIGIRPAMWITV
jgi:hypothetical protein